MCFEAFSCDLNVPLPALRSSSIRSVDSLCHLFQNAGSSACLLLALTLLLSSASDLLLHGLMCSVSANFFLSCLPKMNVLAHPEQGLTGILQGRGLETVSQGGARTTGAYGEGIRLKGPMQDVCTACVEEVKGKYCENVSCPSGNSIWIKRM